MYSKSSLSNKDIALTELRLIPGIGKQAALDLWDLGYRCIADLKNEDPELMYIHHNDLKGVVQDICVLYTYRCAVYFANTYGMQQDPELLKWWHWKEQGKISSVQMDQRIRENRIAK